MSAITEAVLATTTRGGSVRIEGLDDIARKRIGSRLSTTLRKKGFMSCVRVGDDGATYAWAEPREAKAAAPAKATDTPPPAAKYPGRYDDEVRDALVLAGKKGALKPSDIARRLMRDDPSNSLDKLTQAVWSVLQRFVATGEAVKLDTGAYRLAKFA